MLHIKLKGMKYTYNMLANILPLHTLDLFGGVKSSMFSESHVAYQINGNEA